VRPAPLLTAITATAVALLGPAAPALADAGGNRPTEDEDPWGGDADAAPSVLS
jgi:hypothetical protein